MRSPRTIALGLALVVGLTIVAAPAASAGRLERRRDKLLSWVNEYRQQHSRVSLRFDTDLNRMAQQHSRRMADQRLLFHTTDLGTKLRSFRVSVWGENIGYASRLGVVFRMWKHSASHDANLLRTGFRRTGIGVYQARGVLWVTMIYYG
jgi:uncharacterized protein YkwD